MPTLRMDWTPGAKAEFEQIRKRAIAFHREAEFILTHNQMANALTDLTLALEKGEQLYQLKKPGGHVRQWLHGFIAICYALFPDEQVGWIVSYKTFPESWPV
ncbi:MAG: hypothetical protein L0219_11785 [Phycisphaerales bacterium]|nr:hypothetical protein [Phycisphaerales bacterium]